MEQPLKSDAPDSSLLVNENVMQRIHNVIKNTTTPSWIRSVPSNFGARNAGTLKADEWRMLFTVFLPIALISVWGDGTIHHSDSARKRALSVLDITMHLVTAVTISCMGSLTPMLADTYLKSISLWTEGVYREFPKSPVTTNVHMAFHVFDFMFLFGPVRSWWCFAFERLIGHLGRLPHNHVPGMLLLSFN